MRLLPSLSVLSFAPLATVNGDGVSVSVVGLIVGLILAAIVFIVVDWLLGLAKFRYHQPVAALLALLVFLACGFDF